ncbi:MAG: XrtA/PEP-CTERM system TPR-repeat protein PrsT [Steroidobacteraceae bacterium]
MKPSDGPAVLRRMSQIGVLCLSLSLVGCGALIPAHYRIAAARRDMRAGNWRAAAVELGTVVRSHPDNTQAWLLLARVSLDTADPVGAQANLDHALSAGAKGPEVDALRARTWLATGQPQALLNAVAQHGIALNEPTRSLMMARAYLALRQPDKAIGSVQPLLANQPGLTEARVVMAESLATEGQLEQALQQLKVAMQRDPKSPQPPLLQGRILESQGHFAAAERAASLALKHTSAADEITDRVMALVVITESRLALGKIDLAAQSQAVLARTEPDAPMAQLLGARIKLARKNVSGSINQLQSLVIAAPEFVQARMVLGAALLAQGELQQAQEQLARVVEQTPDNVEARKLLAAVSLRLGQPQSALQVLTPALASLSTDPQLLSLLGTAAGRVGNTHAVIDALESNLRAHPQDETLQLDLAQALLNGGRATDALTLLEKTRDDGSQRREALLITATAAVRGAAAAGEQVDKLVAAHPRDSAVLDTGAAFYASQSNPVRAQALLRESLSSNPNDVIAVIALARLQAATGKLTDAQDTLRTALAAHPEALPVRYELAEFLATRRHFNQARSLLQAVDPSKAEPGIGLALASVDLADRDVKAADTALDRAIASAPGQAAPVEEAGLLLLQARQYDAALARLSRATQLVPGNASYWLETARAQLALDQSPAARASLDKALKIHAQWLPAVGALALIDLRNHDGQAALARVDALLAEHPEDPGALALKGDVESALGNSGAALAAYGKAQAQRPTAVVAMRLYREQVLAHSRQPQQPLEAWLARQPNDWRIRDVLGQYYLSANELPSAAREFETVIGEMPADVVALNNLAWVYGKLGNPRAETLAERAVKLAPDSPAVNDTVGWILTLHHRAGEALPYLEKATQLDAVQAKARAATPDLQIQYHYAYALLQAGDRAEARRILTAIVSGSADVQTRREAQRLLAEIKS